MTTGILPQQIPPQSTPFGTTDQSGGIYVSLDWYLFMYNLALQVLGNGSSQGNPTSTFDLSDAVDLDAAGTDIPQAYRGLSNLAALMFSSVDTPPTPSQCAQPAQSVVVGASPFTYMALSDGVVAISGPTMSGSSSVATSIFIIRQGVIVDTGLVSGMVPVRRNDQVKITYSTAPTVVFLPN